MTIKEGPSGLFLFPLPSVGLWLCLLRPCRLGVLPFPAAAESNLGGRYAASRFCLLHFSIL